MYTLNIQCKCGELSYTCVRCAVHLCECACLCDGMYVVHRCAVDVVCRRRRRLCRCQARSLEMCVLKTTNMAAQYLSAIMFFVQCAFFALYTHRQRFLIELLLSLPVVVALVFSLSLNRKRDIYTDKLTTNSVMFIWCEPER